MEPRQPRVLVQLRWQFQFAADVIAGLVANESAPRVEVVARNADAPLAEAVVRALRPSVMVGDTGHESSVRLCQRLGIPFIDLTGSHLPEGGKVHRILPDDAAVGRMAADYLREAGYTHFAFVGFSDQGYSGRRRRGFEEALAGHEVFAHESPLAPDFIGLPEPEMARFLKHLPRPCGIFACSDLRAMALLGCLRRTHKRLPEDVGLVGVDVDLALRRLSGWAFPSIDQAAWFQGWQASQWVRELLKNPHLAPRTLRMPPVAVVDPLPMRADRRLHPVVDDLLRALEKHHVHRDALALALSEIPLSRRAIEHHARRVLGASPQELLHRLRRKSALTLLADPTLPLGEVGRRVGFEFQGDFSRFIKRTLGVPPSVIRICLTRRV